MRARTLDVKRSLSQAALLSSIAIVVAIVTGFPVVGASYLDVASDRVLRSDLAGVPAQITRTLESPALTATRDGTPLGDTPAAVIDASIPADSARFLGPHLGDQIVVGEAPNTITVRLIATWRVADSGSTRWFADLSTTGRTTNAENDTSVFGPILIPESSFPSGDSAPTVRWTVTPDAARSRPPTFHDSPRWSRRPWTG